MARQYALLRVRKTLLARREGLRKALADDLGHLRDFRTGDSTGDNADLAFEAESDGMSSQLAVLDAYELSQIERGLARMQERKYGICEGGSANCQIKIPVSRLNALPYTTLCIQCEREAEGYPNWEDRSATGNRESAVDSESSTRDPRRSLSKEVRKPDRIRPTGAWSGNDTGGRQP